MYYIYIYLCCPWRFVSLKVKHTWPRALTTHDVLVVSFVFCCCCFLSSGTVSFFLLDTQKRKANLEDSRNLVGSHQGP